MLSRIQNFLGPPGEWLAAAGALVTLLSFFLPVLVEVQPKVTAFLKGFGLVVLLGGTLVSIQGIRKRLDQIAGIADSARMIIGYGGAVSVIAEAVSRTQHDLTKTHITASAKALEQYAMTVLQNRAKGLRDLEQGQAQSLQLIEYNYISDFLKHLVEIMARTGREASPAIWFGTSLLTQGWLKEQAEPGYEKFVDAVQRHSKAHRLCVLRMYAYQDHKELDGLKAHLKNEIAAGINVRTMDICGLKPDQVPDLTLIWMPTNLSWGQVTESAEPVELVSSRSRNSSPLCAMEFNTRYGLLVRELTVHAPHAHETSFLVRKFQEIWAQAKPYP